MVLAEYLDRLAAKGRYQFTSDEAVAALKVSPVAARAAMRRLREKGQLAMPPSRLPRDRPPEYRRARLPARGPVRAAAHGASRRSPTTRACSRRPSSRRGPPGAAGLPGRRRGRTARRSAAAGCASSSSRARNVAEIADRREEHPARHLASCRRRKRRRSTSWATPATRRPVQRRDGARRAGRAAGRATSCSPRPRARRSPGRSGSATCSSESAPRTWRHRWPSTSPREVQGVRAASPARSSRERAPRDSRWQLIVNEDVEPDL